MRAALLTALLLPIATVGAAEPEQGRWIDVSLTRAGGTVSLRRVDLDRLKLQERRGPAMRHGADLRARGVPLADLWAGLSLPPGVDLALLRFDDGLVVPIPFRDAAYLARLAPFLVRASSSDRWASLVAGRVEDPSRPPTDEDLRPIRLHGNEVLVSDPGLVEVLPSVRGDLRPFLYADSLHAIELTERAAWEARFDAGEATREGRRVYLGTCGYCHAIRGAGGGLGWDLVDPVPIYSEEWRKRFAAGPTERSPMEPRTALSIHVRHRSGINGNRTMPALRGMKLAEIEALWAWLEAQSGGRR